MTDIQDLHRVGSELWKKTYKVRPGSDDFAFGVTSSFANMHADKKEAINGAVSYLCTTKWVDGGCRIIESDEKYFAAMCQTKLSEDASSELRVPWDSFLVKLPGGLFVGTNGHSYNFALCSQFEAVPRAQTCAFIEIFSSEDSISCLQECSLAELLFRKKTVDTIKDREGASLAKAETQLTKLVYRGITGLLFSMQHTANFRFGGPFSKASSSGRGSPPAHRSIVIGRPIDVDVSEPVRQSARSGCAPPAFQTLVRGHIKRQVVGLGRSGRKVVWVEPYWRGPEDAPILARPYRITHRMESSQ